MLAYWPDRLRRQRSVVDGRGAARVGRHVVVLLPRAEARHQRQVGLGAQGGILLTHLPENLTESAVKVAPFCYSATLKRPD